MTPRINGEINCDILRRSRRYTRKSFQMMAQTGAGSSRCIQEVAAAWEALAGRAGLTVFFLRVDICIPAQPV